MGIGPHEDGAERAVRVGLGIAEAVVTGDTIIIAARLREIASADGIVLSVASLHLDKALTVGLSN